jgi:hypothetical protein
MFMGSVAVTLRPHIVKTDSAQDFDAAQVDAVQSADSRDDHEHARAGAAADDRARPAEVDRGLGHWAYRAACGAGCLGAGHIGGEDLQEQAADGVAV